MDIEEQAPSSLPPQAAIGGPLAFHNIRTLRANNRAVRQGNVGALPAKAVQALDKVTRGKVIDDGKIAAPGLI
ncbi:hypothetical protein C343_03359 [Cryptococcus neoformans C23]|uniref:Uncharacterized protein n=1 Tax=Cryptococcus neoformans (strain H99 / ATCC 208821 / CBS 10515 / FGSC 9487) TaxID=235443 RepID=J9VLA0_CRYN9|nr:hypothetical protein CNAG_00868 [Cryptococcus neoformans var. grubii H99]AUB25041.1 hypothetical protein CKF44_00868 [Cryptococcus neoformans var. grubii]OWZ31857.1 hypothetical protein C347_03422 [Cryptococcus neoformans var. grubii AD2-60a]OWZ43932.1 hypothetical protein C343_03359 [Cryptococcus neoformans var. grubii C23]OWZ77677.1 hypothetical protein C365_04014 [Cryptococcus neoformans var. grubii Bt85]OXC61371.1 hypothetical protein C358_03198 [Cryptococcus neoformans var. grubii MW-R|eukprot:XP_012049159.1 hypothetical protein CNAG_00868 [Cryptococcus neoformans var. grubii H99]